MPQTTAVFQVGPTNDALSSWFRAYLRFLFSRDESLTLKVAPLALIGVLPIDLVSNIIPGIGLFDDAGYLLFMAIVLYKTFIRVNYYRRNPSSRVAAPQ